MIFFVQVLKTEYSKTNCKFFSCHFQNILLSLPFENVCDFIYSLSDIREDLIVPMFKIASVLTMENVTAIRDMITLLPDLTKMSWMQSILDGRRGINLLYLCCNEIDDIDMRTLIINAVLFRFLSMGAVKNMKKSKNNSDIPFLTLSWSEDNQLIISPSLLKLDCCYLKNVLIYSETICTDNQKYHACVRCLFKFILFFIFFFSVWFSMNEKMFCIFMFPPENRTSKLANENQT